MLKINKEHVSMLMLIEAYAEKHKAEERIDLFKVKYKQNFSEFEKHVYDREESFEQYDDLMEWKAYENALNDIKQRIHELQSGNIQFA